MQSPIAENDDDDDADEDNDFFPHEMMETIKDYFLMSDQNDS
jgi:hypothetical protein